MKTKLKLFHARLVCAVALGIGSSSTLVTAADSTFTDANWSSMNPRIPGADAIVRAAVLDGTGNLYIGGDFTVVGDVVARGVAKWDGRKWSSLGADIDVPSHFAVGARVHALAVSGGDLYVAGQFTTAGGVAATNIAKWNGSSWTALGSGLGNEYDGVNALAVYDGSLYAGGSFTNAGDVAANSIVKWNGSGWSPLGLGISGGYSGAPSIVSALAVSGSNLYVGGSFRIAGGVTANGIARWDGSGWSALGSGVHSTAGRDPLVAAIAISGSDLYVGGWFTTAGVTGAGSIAKWNGSNWSALGSGMNNNVLALAVMGSDLYAGGYFNSVPGGVTNAIAKWDGTHWSALGTGVTDSVFSMAVSSSDLYVGGNFITAGGTAANSIAKWDGTSWRPIASDLGFNGSVQALAMSGKDLYAGGEFTTAPGTAANSIAKWNGTKWFALGSGINGPVSALLISGSNVYAGGTFTNAGGAPANYVAKWNGSGWSALGSGLSGDPLYGTYVSALAVSGADVYVGGSFTNADGIAANNIARWDGNHWGALGSGITAGTLSALAVSGTNLYAGGSLYQAGSVSVLGIARWDGNDWSALEKPAGLVRFNVSALAVLGNDLYASATTAPASFDRVFKWNGSNWSELGTIVPHVLSLAVSGGHLYAGGGPAFEGGNYANYVAEWDGTSWSSLASAGDYPYAFALAVSGTDLYVGGRFATVGGKVSPFLARAYLQTLPVLSVSRAGANVMVSWTSADSAEFALEQRDALNSPTNWVTNTAPVSDDGVQKSVTLPATNNAQFFRLRR